MTNYATMTTEFHLLQTPVRMCIYIYIYHVHPEDRPVGARIYPSRDEINFYSMRRRVLIQKHNIYNIRRGTHDGHHHQKKKKVQNTAAKAMISVISFHFRTHTRCFCSNRYYIYIYYVRAIDHIVLLQGPVLSTCMNFCYRRKL